LRESEHLRGESKIVATLAKFEKVRSPYRKFHKELKKPAAKKPVRSSSRLSNGSQSRQPVKPVESDFKSRYMRINSSYQPKKPIIAVPSIESKPIKSSLSRKGSKRSNSKSQMSSSFISVKRQSGSRRSVARSNGSRSRLSSTGRSHSSL